jgi:hypothetical protein
MNRRAGVLAALVVIAGGAVGLGIPRLLGAIEDPSRARDVGARTAPLDADPSVAPATMHRPDLAPRASTSPRLAPTATALEVTWQPATGLADGAEVRHIDVVNGQWFASGLIWPAPAIWTSTDGLSWTPASVTSDRAADEYATVNGIADAGGILVAAGTYGLQQSDQSVPTTWISYDGGLSWTEDRGDVRPWSTVEEIPGGIIGTAGDYVGTTPFDSWIVLSGDGSEWRRVNSELFTDSQIIDFVVVGERVIASGWRSTAATALQPAPTAWISDDGGQTWSAHALPVPDGWIGAHAFEIAHVGDSVVVAGYLVSTDVGLVRPVAWVSTDTVSWSHTQLGSDAVARAVAGVGGGAIVAGHASADQIVGFEIAWTSGNLAAWDEHQAFVGGGLSVIASEGRGTVILMGGEGDVPIWRGLTAEK